MEATTTAAARGAGLDLEPAKQAYLLLRIGFTVAPILAGLDKFMNVLTDWDKYLAPVVADLVPAGAFMSVVGLVEIVAGLLVAFRPRLGGYIVSAWLVGIIGNLALAGGWWDIALRDLGLAIGAFALARLATTFGD